MIRHHYRNVKVNEIKAISKQLENGLLSEDYLSEKILNDTYKKIYNSNVCAVVFNQNGKIVFRSDNLGESCFTEYKFNYHNEVIDISAQPLPLIKRLNYQNNIDISYHLDNINKDMIVYGTKCIRDFSSYYIFINGALEPLDIYFDFLANQYTYLTFIVGIIAILFAYLWASRFSRPLIQMKKSAEELAKGNYHRAKFEGGDYSEYEVLANTLNDATDKLSKIDELRKDLIANVSHDLKTPLTMIEAYAEMVRDLSGDDQVKRYEHLNVILNEAKYLDKLVDDISELSKMQAGIAELNKENFDLKEIVLDISHAYEVLLKQRDLDLKLEVVSVIVYADILKIKQVINNYISNAIKYTNDHTTITIKIIDNPTNVRLEVIDMGEGIKLEDQPYIWERYYKIDKQFRRSIYQSGLGLAIAKAILEAHGANYGVISKEGSGSIFFFEINKEYE